MLVETLHGLVEAVERLSPGLGLVGEVGGEVVEVSGGEGLQSPGPVALALHFPLHPQPVHRLASLLHLQCANIHERYNASIAIGALDFEQKTAGP